MERSDAERREDSLYDTLCKANQENRKLKILLRRCQDEFSNAGNYNWFSKGLIDELEQSLKGY